jgi:hypothetical protein
MSGEDPHRDRENRKRRKEFDRLMYWIAREEQRRPEQKNDQLRALYVLAVFVVVLVIMLVIVWAGAFVYVAQHRGLQS